VTVGEWTILHSAAASSIFYLEANKVRFEINADGARLA